MTASETTIYPPLETPDGVYTLPPPLHPPETSQPSAITVDRAALKALSHDQLIERVVAAESALNSYQTLASTLLSHLALSPELTSYYSRTLRSLLTTSLLTLDSIQSLLHVECSMPCVPHEHPAVSMLSWSGLQYSEWNVQWNPTSWWVSVSVLGSRWGLSFNCLTRVERLKLNGVVRCAFSPDLSAVRVAFRQRPIMHMDVESRVGWGVVPIPVREGIEHMVRLEIESFVERRLMGEESLVVVLRRRGVGVAESDVEEARVQAERATSVQLTSGLLL